MAYQSTERELLRSGPRFTVGILLTIGMVMAVTLAFMGRVLWCEAGDWTPWSFDVWSQHNSQHLLDPYSLSHFQHGIALFLFLAWIPQRRLPLDWRIIVVAVVEAIWEVSENTPWIISRYREATVSLDYYGDSIANSVSDYGMCLAGAVLARKASWQISVSIFVTFELICVIWIRDSLLLNILMLVWPVDAVRQWQAIT